jgi:hypothetical protein
MRTNHLVTIETKAPRLAMCSGPETAVRCGKRVDEHVEMDDQNQKRPGALRTEPRRDGAAD